MTPAPSSCQRWCCTVAKREINQEALDTALDDEAYWSYGQIDLDPEDVGNILRTYLETVNPLVTTKEELEQLPLGTVVLDETDDLMQYLPDGEGDSYWMRIGDTGIYGPEDVFLPAQVVQMGEV